MLSHSQVAELVGLYLQGDSEVWEPNAATMLMRRAIGEGWDGYDELEGKDFTQAIIWKFELLWFFIHDTRRIQQIVCLKSL